MKLLFHTCSLQCLVITPISCISFSDSEEIRKVKEDGGSYGWLEEVEIPKESEMDGIEYMGPQVNDFNCS